ncbi:MAG: S41 family peptidase [Verrucomicrobiales bacterium]
MIYPLEQSGFSRVRRSLPGRRSFLRMGAAYLGAVGSAWLGSASFGTAQDASPPAPADDWKPLLQQSFTLLEEHCLYEIQAATVLRKMLALMRAKLPPDDAKALAEAERNTIEEGLLGIFDQTIKLAATKAPRGPVTSLVIMQSVLQQYARSLDRYSDYTPPEDFAMLQSLEAERYLGLGFNLVEGEDGLFRCFPFPAEAAELAGLLPGDQLLAIDGKATTGMSRYRIAAAARGQEGTIARLEVLRANQRPRVVEIKRTVISTSPIQTSEGDGGMTIRIIRFNEQTTRDLGAILLQLPAGSNLVIDMQACPGGELEATIACASMFVSQGEEVCRTVTRLKEEVHLSKNPSPFRAGSLVIKQNEGTASAGEMFIAALTADAATRAVSRGPVTYGKGMTQTEFGLKAGGALKITDSRLLGPGGRSWEREGLQPTEPT